jgi:hypothetical protein
MLESNMSLAERATRKIERTIRDLNSDWNLRRSARAVDQAAPRTDGRKPVIFFNASTRIAYNSYNAGYSLIASWALRLAGVPVIHFVCQEGMTRCVLGTDPDHPDRAPACEACLKRSQINYTAAEARYFTFHVDAEVRGMLADLDLDGLAAFVHRDVPLGALVLPALRWRFRAHHLVDDEPTRFVFREYIQSAWNIFCEIERLLDETGPQALIVFNGQFFPEATASWAARRRGIRTITHEVGLQPFSAFFTEGEATAYPIRIPNDFRLSAEQAARLDSYLEKRFKGQFSMAGIRFWPEMKGLDQAFLDRARAFRQIVPVFTNVIFDTSQPHANTLFPDMFTWLETVLDLARSNPDTLFVIRAHPDETRPGKESRETVQAWVSARKAIDLPNVVFVASDEYFSSYELIQRSKFVMIYNSTIGLEAAILGVPVLSAGRARFTQYPIVFFPGSIREYLERAEEFLAADRIAVPPEFSENARKFLYYQLFKTSLPFDGFLTGSEHPSFARFKKFDRKKLLPENSPALRTFIKGMLQAGDFLLEEES